MTYNMLEEIEAIRKLKARYFRLLDTRQLDAWKELFTPDVHIHWETIGSRDSIFDNREDMFASVSKLLSATENPTRTIHHGHMGEIDITSATTATGIWPMFDYVLTPKMSRQGYGHYHEDYVKNDGVWLIKKLHLTRLHCEYGPADSELFG